MKKELVIGMPAESKEFVSDVSSITGPWEGIHRCEFAGGELVIVVAGCRSGQQKHPIPTDFV
jgi:hypothetical protein